MPQSAQDHLLTISELAERTGSPAATLRSWESRYGFPEPSRLAGGHRRYREPDVAAVLRVLRHRDSGFALEAAVRRVKATSLQTRSVHAELRRQHPELVPQLLSKPSLVALSHAIEDECCARAEEPMLFGGFQRDTFVRQSYARWVELARTARVAVVFTDVATPRPPRRGMPIEVPLPADAPLMREWIVVCDAPDLPPAWQPSSDPVRTSHDSAPLRGGVVGGPASGALRQPGGGDARRRLPAGMAHRRARRLDGEPPSASADVRRASDLLNRMMGYLDARH
jgi:DNA-binding transcriptional MerR regulator